MLDEGKTTLFNASILDDSRAARKQLDELQDRHSEFLELERSIREIHDLFLELKGLVSQQGESVNNIASHFEQITESVKKAREELQEAERYKHSARKKKLICLILLLLVGLIVLLWVLSDLGAFSSSGEDQEIQQPLISATGILLI